MILQFSQLTFHEKSTKTIEGGYRYPATRYRVGTTTTHISVGYHVPGVLNLVVVVVLLVVVAVIEYCEYRNNVDNPPSLRQVEGRGVNPGLTDSPDGGKEGLRRPSLPSPCFQSSTLTPLPPERDGQAIQGVGSRYG